MSFRDDLRGFINLTHAFAWSRVQAGSAPIESGYVSAFMDSGMQQELQGVIRSSGVIGGGMFLTSVFTHQTPRVRPVTQTNGIELGDLLLVRQHFPTVPTHQVTGSALLLQAKKSVRPKTGAIPSGNPTIQFDLYQNWPDFTGQTRLQTAPVGFPAWDFRTHTIAGSQASESGEYLTIFDGEPYGRPLSGTWTGAPASGSDLATLSSNGYPPVGASDPCSWSHGPVLAAPATAGSGVDCPHDFSALLEGVIQGTSGRRFQSGVLAGPDHWSIFVNTMLSLAGNLQSPYVFRLKNQGVIGAPRHQQVSSLVAGALAGGLWSTRPSSAHDWNFIHDLSTFMIRLCARLKTPFPFESTDDGGWDGDSFGPGGGNEGHVPVFYLGSIGEDYPEGLGPIDDGRGSDAFNQFRT